MILAPQRPVHVASVGLAFPPNIVDEEATVSTLRRLFPGEDPQKISCMVQRSGVRRRHIVPTLEEVLAPSDFTDRNSAYHGAAVELASSACRQALDRADMRPWDVDVLIDVSCTGIAIPALDVSIVPEVGLRPDVRRIPITEAGCAGGALGLNVAAGLAQSGMTALVVAVEVCSLSLVHGDETRTNLVASVIFGDGAAAAVVAPHGPGPRIEAMRSHLIPDTREIMGFDVGSHGMRIVLDRELPAIVAERLPGVVADFVATTGRTAAGIDLHLIHPGGRSILEAYETYFGLGPEELRYSRSVLAERGNLSSASILAVLERALEDRRETDTDETGLLLAIGPGLSLEMALLQWEASETSS